MRRKFYEKLKRKFKLLRRICELQKNSFKKILYAIDLIIGRGKNFFSFLNNNARMGSKIHHGSLKEEQDWQGCSNLSNKKWWIEEQEEKRN